MTGGNSLKMRDSVNKKLREVTHLGSAVLEERGAETSTGEAHADALLMGAVYLSRLAAAIEGPLLGGTGARLLDATVVPHDERTERPPALQPVVQRAPLSARHHLFAEQTVSLLSFTFLFSFFNNSFYSLMNVLSFSSETS